jgi:hypothetical protein
MNPRSRPARVSLTHLVSIGSRLTSRDRQIALDCYHHHVLTTGQLQRLHFTGRRTAAVRLDLLYRLRVLDRFRPAARPGTGTTSYHWILDEAGAHIIAAHYGIERRALKWRHASDRALEDSPKLRHLTEINEFFAQLAYEAKSQRGGLTEWYSERAIHGLFGGIIWPDGYGVLTLRDRPPVHFLPELDRATEPTATLRDKAERYARAIPRSTLAEHHPVVVLAVPTQARARAASTAIAHTGAPLTVAAWSKATPYSALAIVTATAETRTPRPHRHELLTPMP